MRHLICPDLGTGSTSFLFIEIPTTCSFESDEASEEYAKRQVHAVTRQHGLPEPSEIRKVTRPFTCRETHLNQCSFGNNVLVIGDAARSGNYNSGIAFNLVLVKDLEDLGAFVQGTRSISDCARSIQETSRFFCDVNLSRFY